MIPIFPRFKKLELGDKKHIESFTKQHPSYSDFNFVSLWSYNVLDNCKISVLNDNFVIKLPDYLTSKPIFSFLGDNRVLETTTALLKLARAKGMEATLKLIPEINLKKEKMAIGQKFNLLEDDSNHDYILSVKNLIFLKGKKFKSKRRLINRIKANSKIKTKSLNLQSKKIQKEIKDLFYFWKKIKNKKQREVAVELTALKRLVESASSFNLVSLGFYKKDKMAGITINEILPDKYYMGHFGKTDNTQGLSKYMEHKTAKILSEFGCQYMNFQQDLGIPGLKKSKRGWQPVRYFKKFIISEKNLSR